MFQNYFKTAWRNIMRGKGYSALNIFGLATGMAVALIIGLWVYNQFAYDKFLPGYNQLYQVRRNFYGNGDTMNLWRHFIEIGRCAEKSDSGNRFGCGNRWRQFARTDGG